MTPPAWAMSTYQPQPRVSWGSPSRAQPHGPPLTWTALHSTVVTVPAAAARMVVLRGATRSTPSWPGRSVVRNPDPTGAWTGWVQPPEPTGAPHAGRPASLTPIPEPIVATSETASSVHLAYAFGYALFWTRCAASVNG